MSGNGLQIALRITLVALKAAVPSIEALEGKETKSKGKEWN